MPCDRFIGAIQGLAHGVPLAPAAAAHLAVCADCQDALAIEERVLAGIDCAINEVGSVRPSANFVIRVRTRVESAGPRFTSVAYAPAAVAAAALIVASLVVGRVSPDSAPVRVDVESSARETGSQPPPTTAVPAARVLPAAGRRPARVPKRAEPSAPEVLVPPGQREAYDRLFDALRAGRPDVVSSLMRLERASLEPVVVPALPDPGSIFDK